MKLMVFALSLLLGASTFAASNSTKLRAPAATAEATQNRNAVSASSVAPARTREAGNILKGFVASGLLTSTSAQYSSRNTAGSTLYDSQTLGAKVGYAQVNVARPGMMARLAIGTKVGGGDEWDDYSYVRPEVNATYGFNNLTYIMGGLNTNKFFRGNDYKAYGMTLGWQAGLGMELAANTFGEIQYVYTKNDYSSPDRSADREQRNLELALGYNF